MIVPTQSINRILHDLIRQGELTAGRAERAAEQIIYEPNQPAAHFYLIESGQVRTFQVASDGTPRLLDIFGMGDWLGTESLGLMPQHVTRAVTVTDVVLTEIPTEALQGALQSHPHLALLAIKTLANRLHRSWTYGSEFVSEDAKIRLVKTLLRYSTSPAARADGQGVVLKITHTQLAQAVGAARETVSVCLADLRLRKLIRTERNLVRFNPDELRVLDREIAPGE